MASQRALRITAPLWGRRCCSSYIFSTHSFMTSLYHVKMLIQSQVTSMCLRFYFTFDIQMPVFHFSIPLKSWRALKYLTIWSAFTLQTYFCTETAFLFGLQGRICCYWVAAYKLSVKQKQGCMKSKPKTLATTLQKADAGPLWYFHFQTRRLSSALTTPTLQWQHQKHLMDEPWLFCISLFLICEGSHSSLKHKKSKTISQSLLINSSILMKLPRQNITRQKKPNSASCYTAPVFM